MAHAKINLQRMYDWIEQCLNAGTPTPDDAAICERFGFESTELARTMLADLADAGRITIKGYGDARVVSLGRTPSVLAKAAASTPSVKKRDIDLEEGVAKIAAILARRSRPHPSVQAAPAPVVPAPITPTHPAPAQARSEAMATAAGVRNITIQARDDLRLLIEQRAERDGVALGRAAQDLVEAGLRAENAPASVPSAPFTMVELSNVPDAWIAEEVVRRIHAGVGSDDYDAAVARADASMARAEAAEGQLATLRAQISLLLSNA